MLKEFKITVYTDDKDLSAEDIDKNISVVKMNNHSPICIVEVVDIEEIACGEPVDKLESIIIKDPITEE